MKEILFYILFISFLIYSSEKKLYELFKYGQLIYTNTNQTYSFLNITGIEEEQIEIIYKIQKNHNHDEYKELYYGFTNIIPDDNNCKVEKSIKGIIKDSLENEIKITYNITKEEGEYLVLLNIKCNEGESIVVEHIKNEKKQKPKKENGDGKDNKGNKSLIAIIIISIMVVAGIIIGFIILGKYIYNKRQQEVMGSYASSFVDENPGLVPNNEQKENTNDDNNPK